MPYSDPSHQTAPALNRAAPMPSAPMRYGDDGSVQWDDMWDTFCELAQTGGPPHRAELLLAQVQVDVTRPSYQVAASEIVRGVQLVSGLRAWQHSPGWIALQCESPAHAHWLCEAGMAENVQTRAVGDVLLLPCGEHYALTGEIKNVVTVVAKTTHYWREHLMSEVKSALAVEQFFARVGALFGRRRTARM